MSVVHTARNIPALSLRKNAGKPLVRSGDSQAQGSGVGSGLAP